MEVLLQKHRSSNFGAAEVERSPTPPVPSSPHQSVVSYVQDAASAPCDLGALHTIKLYIFRSSNKWVAGFAQLTCRGLHLFRQDQPELAYKTLPLSEVVTICPIDRVPKEMIPRPYLLHLICYDKSYYLRAKDSKAYSMLLSLISQGTLPLDM